MAWTADGIGTATVVVEGEVDAASAPLFERALTEAVAVATSVVVVDLAGVSFMDAAGLRVLLTALHETTARGTCLQVDHVTSSVRRLFRAAQVDDRFATATGQG